MTSCVPWWRWPLTINKNKKSHKNTRGQFRGCKKQQSSMQKPGIPQPGSPRSQRAAFTAWPSPWHFEANTDKAGSQRKWWEELTQWNWRVVLRSSAPQSQNVTTVPRDPIITPVNAENSTTMRNSSMADERGAAGPGYTKKKTHTHTRTQQDCERPDASTLSTELIGFWN